MVQVIIQPAANPAAQRHLRDTIYADVPLTRVSPHLEPQDAARLSAIFTSGYTQVWGVQPVKRAAWNRIQVGDQAYFSARNEVFLVGTVQDTLYNESLAADLWGTDAEGVSWPYIYFLSDLTEVSIPVSEVNAVLGYDPQNVLRGFMVLGQGKSDLFIDRFSPDAQAGAYRALVRRIDADPDRPSNTMIRLEQSSLRGQLLSGRTAAPCAICSEIYPVELLVAAHIKPRAKCSTQEKLDPHIAVLMCTFGCDALYERGYIVVKSGAVQSRPTAADPATISLRLSALDGLACPQSTPERSKYFKWHESNVGR